MLLDSGITITIIVVVVMRRYNDLQLLMLRLRKLLWILRLVIDQGYDDVLCWLFFCSMHCWYFIIFLILFLLFLHLHKHLLLSFELLLLICMMGIRVVFKFFFDMCITCRIRKLLVYVVPSHTVLNFDFLS